MYALRNSMPTFAIKYHPKYSTLQQLISQQQCEHLNNRSLIKVIGKDASTLLQGLITNDINYLSTKAVKSIYTMFLNSKGRVLCDSLIYTTGEENVYLLECDNDVKTTLMKHLAMYKLRKQVEIQAMNNMNLYAVFKANIPEENSYKLNPELDNDVGSRATDGEICNEGFVYSDPRLQQLGHRIVSEKKQNEIANVMKVSKSSQLQDYRWWRYSLGVGEGVVDIPPNNAFPLESNCDYLNGISFQKGCYLGQELTARTFHTGMVRKRLMPLYFPNANQVESSEATLLDDAKQNIGKLRGIHCDRGLALLRIRLVLGKELPIEGRIASTQIPSWWPKQKEENTVKNEIKA